MSYLNKKELQENIRSFLILALYELGYPEHNVTDFTEENKKQYEFLAYNKYKEKLKFSIIVDSITKSMLNLIESAHEE